MNPAPPRLAQWLLSLMPEYDDRFYASGDLAEFYQKTVRRDGKRSADRWYRRQIMASLFPYFLFTIKWRFIMFFNYLKITWRNIRRQKMFSLINIGSLAIGFACCLLIWMFVQDELSYDRFHPEGERIFRVVSSTSRDRVPTNANGSLGWGPLLKNAFPEVLEHVRIRKMGQGSKLYMGYKEKKFYEEWFFFAEPSIFKVFNFPLLRGNRNTVLTDPNTIVLTQEMAEKYFPREDPIGKVIEADPYNTGEMMYFRITGIAANVPHNSHIHFDFLASYMSQKEDTNNVQGFWTHYTYLLLDRPSSRDMIEPGLFAMVEKHFMKNPWYTISLQPLLDIHLRSGLRSEIQPTGSIGMVYIFSMIAVLVLVIACINFINLNTARSVKRAKEVGLRKQSGARRGQLTRQFLSESVAYGAVAMMGAAGLTFLMLPVVNRLSDKQLTMGFFLDPMTMLMVFLLSVTVGLIAGIYPAFCLSSFKPVNTLRGGFGPGSGRSILRKGLVTFQFVLSIGMILATLITMRQMDFIRSRNPGYDKDQVLAISLNRDIRSSYKALRGELLSHPAVENTATSSYVPTRGSAHLAFKFEKLPEFITQVLYLIDKDFADTYGLKLLAGETMKRENSNILQTEYMISDQTRQIAKYDSPNEALGNEVAFAGNFGKLPRGARGPITGVVGDINIYSLHQEPYPIVYMNSPIDFHNYLSIRLRAGQIAAGLEHLSAVWRQMIPNYPLSYFFINESFDKMHRADQRMGEVFSLFAILTIVVACLGLFGLTAYTVEQKTREIGIRKALGANVSNIYLLMTGEFLKWVLLANIVAWPLAYIFMNRWLKNFVYRIPVGIDFFLLSGGIALVLALATISFMSLKAARAKPVDTLKYE